MSKKIENPQKEEIRNVFIAMILVSIILFLFNPFVEDKKIVESQNQTANISQSVDTENQSTLSSNVEKKEHIEIAVPEAKKMDPILMKNNYIQLSFDPSAGRINELSLLRYKETLKEDSKNVKRFDENYSTSIQWNSRDAQMPLTSSAWALDTEKSTDLKKVFIFKNEDIIIERTILIDDKYMVTLSDTITNLKQDPIKVFQTSQLNRFMNEKPQPSTVHQGFVGYLNNELVEEKYDNKKVIFSERTKSGWFGFTDKYWQELFVFNSDDKSAISFTKEGENQYKAQIETNNILIQPNESKTHTLQLFAGAKDIDVIKEYQQKLNIPHFELSMDFGWFRFLTQPFLHFLNWLYGLIGNMGLAIIVFATLIRIALLPIATKSYESMAKMRKVQPKLKSIQQRFQKDPKRLQIEMANLYRREKINPASGCLPLLLQIPVFFALYKVLSISINMRQAPFFGWIQDLSMPDPLTVFNGFGYFDWNVPAILCIGIWPILMGLTMYMQQKLSPAPTDKTQARIMQFLPVIFTLMMGSFASGLIIYWTWSNVLSIIQQKYIMKKVGV